jgi:hypothetical protein
MNNENDSYNIILNIIFNIKNLKLLDKESINNIRNMSNEDIMKIIIAYNEIIAWVSEIIEQDTTLNIYN